MKNQYIRLINSLGTREKVAKRLGLTVQALYARLRGASKIRKEHVLAAKYLREKEDTK